MDSSRCLLCLKRLPSFPGKPDFPSAGAKGGLSAVVPLALLIIFQRLCGFYTFTFILPTCSLGFKTWRDGAAPLRGRGGRVRKAAPPPRGRDQHSLGEPGPGPGAAVPSRYISAGG